MKSQPSQKPWYRDYNFYLLYGCGNWGSDELCDLLEIPQEARWLGKDEWKGPFTSVPPSGKHSARKKRIKKSDPSRWGEQKTGQLWRQTVCWFLSKSNTGWQHGPATALLVLPPRDLNTGTQTCVHMFKRWTQRQRPSAKDRMKEGSTARPRDITQP